MTLRRRLVFLTTADPRTAIGPAGTAYHVASVAARTGLEAKVRLAGDAVRLAPPDGVGDGAEGRALRARALEDAPFLVAVCPSCVGTREVSQEQVASIHAVLRGLDVILTEVAAGRSEMIYIG